MATKLISSVLFVRDIQDSRRFYEEVLDQKVLMDHGPNIGFEGGFALWQCEHAGQIIFGNPIEGQGALGQKVFELYFETTDLDAGCKTLEAAGTEIIHPLFEQPWGQRVIRFYDPDHHIIELAEPMDAPIFRFLAQGLSLEEIAQRTSMPLEIIRQIANTRKK